MYNYLRSNRTAALVALVPATANGNGGVALWDVPPTIACANNPIMFTRTKYYFRIDGEYESPFSRQPNYVSVNAANTSLVFQYQTTARLYVKLAIRKNAQISEYVTNIYSGTTEWRLSDVADQILEIKGISFSADYFTDFVKDDNYIYVRYGYAYEDKDYVCHAVGERILYRNIEADTCEFKVYKADGSYQKLTAESFKGYTKFDASAVVRQWMGDDFSSMSGNLVADSSLSAKFKIRDIGGAGWSADYLAVNAVAQIGETSDLSARVGKVLSGFDRLSLYNGYDLDYSILAGVDEVVTARGNARAMAVSRVKADDAFDLLADKNSDLVGTEISQKIGLQHPLDIIVISKCTPVNPFYVRWLNRFGGVEYFMFSRQQKRSKAVKSTSSYTPFVEDTLRAKTNRKNYALTTEQTIVVGAVGLSEEVYDEIERMPFSSRIEWYNEKAGKWIALSVSKFTGEYNNRNATSSFEVTFSLPDINTQF